MIRREDIVSAARGWLGVPWQHQGRGRHGIDCIGLVIAVAKTVGAIDADFDVRGYGRHPDARVLLPTCRELMREIEPAHLASGDVLVLSWSDEPHHFAVVCDYPQPCELGIVHATARGGRQVVECRLDGVWRGRIVAAFSFVGVA